VPAKLDLFNRARRTRIVWDIDAPCSWETLADRIANDESDQILCVVNLKRHAQRLFLLLKDRGVPGLFHLSTNMCPAHRKRILKKVRKRLNPEASEPCRLISTQCIEAGVDVDFPTVYRAFGPLEAIAQAAGRCNRNGNLESPGIVKVFLPSIEEGEKTLYPPGGYQQAADATLTMLKQYGSEGMDINDPRLFDNYYKLLYDLLNNTDPPEELKDALGRRHFVDAASQYRLINQDAINILTPYKGIYQDLIAQLEQDGKLTRGWISKARPYAVSLFRPKWEDEVWNFLQPVPLGPNEKSEDWYIYLRPEHYSKEIGLNPVRGVDAWLA
jgi:CRISPR/Cas system-associated endonuclease/helicase Cas3